jgi:hypothetical protein
MSRSWSIGPRRWWVDVDREVSLSLMDLKKRWMESWLCRGGGFRVRAE